MALRDRLSPLSIVLGMVLALVGSSGYATPARAAEQVSGHRVLTGADAADFQIPADVRLISTWREPKSGLLVERYQQYAAPRGVFVDGAQLSVVHRGQRQVLVTGAHYPGLRASMRAGLEPARAIDIAALDRSVPTDLPADAVQQLDRQSELRIDPVSGRLLYVVESKALGIRTFHKIDAQTGAVLAAWDAIDRVSGMGTGVKGDSKSVLGLTSLISGNWKMKSADSRFLTWDARHSGNPSNWILANDNASGLANDNDWNAPAQGAAVDAQYYAALTNDFYVNELEFELISPECGISQIQSVVHFGYGYQNAFWDGKYMVYGDGGSSTRAFSAAQDVVTHELSHAVTECRVNLEYQGEPGALNEAFSDIMATAVEFDLAEPLDSHCRLAPGQTECADWLLGEDVILDPSVSAFRDFANPAAQDQPSHYSQRYTGTGDYGGVHINSGIVNHAFYLMVHGGRNARCSGPTDAQADCDVYVPPISMADAQRIIFMAWAGPLMTEPSQFCEARDASVAAAEVLFPGSAAQRVAVELAWAAVGVAPCAAPVAGFRISLASRSIALGPGGSGQLPVQLIRGSGHSASVSFSVSDAAPATANASSVGVTPGESGLISINVPPGAVSAAVPLLISANDGTTTRYAAAALIIDADAPQAGVSGVRLPSSGQIPTSGNVPLTVNWSATDVGSGIASAHLQYNPIGSDWPNVSSPYTAAPGPHRFRATATDGVGNTTTSGAFLRNLGAYQETNATFAGSWSSYNTGSAWGTTRFSKQRGASATLNFSGTDVVWVAQTGPKRGKVKVYLDGALTRVDLRSASLSERRIVFSATNLTPGAHTLKIVVRGTSGRPRVDIDGFLVLAP